jgi:acetyl-CoA synthetase
MARDRTSEVSEAEIAVHWQEEDYIRPPKTFIAQANLKDAAVFDRFSLDKFPECFKEYADLLDWYKSWDVTLDTSHPPFWRWFVGGQLNASYNCVDRHLSRYKNKTAIHFVPEPEHEAIQHVTYQELFIRVNEVAALLRDFCGLKKGDRVTLHMPMVPELAITMLACARLGIIHSQVFSGFSGKATADRIVDSESRVLITMDAYYRGGQLLDHKEKADIAFDEAKKDTVTLEKVLVWQRYPGRNSAKTPLVEGRDFVVNETLSIFRHRHVDPVSMPAEDPLFLMYTSGTTDRKAEGLSAQHRRVSRLCRGNLEIHSGYPSRGCVLVHGRYRLDHRPFLYRLRAARARCLLGGVRGFTNLSRRRASVAYRRRARRQYISHVPDGNSRSAPRRA